MAFEGKVMDAERVVKFALEQALKRWNLLGSGAGRRPLTEASPRARLKVNFDGSMSRSGGGARVMFRDHNGTPLLVVGKVSEARSMMEIGIMAAWLGVVATVRDRMREYPVVLGGD